MKARSDRVESARLLERLTALHPKLIDLSLGRIERLLAALGHPERRLPPVIHIAGTNGKGSTLAFLAAILRAAGKVAHSYTSPHLVHFHERIALGGTPISEDRLAKVLSDVEDANAGAPITFFEITTAAALYAFAETPADFILLETGLGGRFDATNVIAAPAAAIITPIGIDHTEFLGGSLTEIATEKAGILKQGVPVFIGRQPAEAMDVLHRHARKLDAPISILGRDFDASAHSGGGDGGGMGWKSGGTSLDLVSPSLAGPHQIDNAALAIACARALPDISLTPETLNIGLASAHWPGRLQHLNGGALAALAPPGWEIWIDGGHNADAGQALARAIVRWADKPLYLIGGMMGTKAADDFLRPLAEFVTSAVAVPIPDQPNGFSAQALAKDAAAAGIQTTTSTSIPDAIRQITEAKPAPGRVLITGSLYLAGAALALNDR